MALRSFDDRFPVVGKRIYDELGTSPAITNQSELDGQNGSIDSIGHPKPYTTGGNFTLDRYDKKLPRFSGTVDKVVRIKCENFCPDTAVLVPAAASVVTFDTINDILARSNPSRPIVDVPVFVAELRDLPRMLLELKDIPGWFHDTGLVLIDRLAKGNLSYQFGWKPFVKDLISFLNWQSLVDKRLSELNTLHRKGGLRFETQPQENSIETPWVDGGATHYDTLRKFSKDVRVTRQWYSVSWVPQETPRSSVKPVSATRQQAFRSALGLEISAAPLWEAMPWSWLIDWFSDFGSFLNAGRNSAGFVPGQCFTMTHTKRLRFYEFRKSSVGSWHADFSPTPGYYQREIKKRVLGSGSAPTIRVPIISMRQWGILASLEWLKIRKS